MEKVSDVVVFRSSLDLPNDEIEALYDVLDASERARAARFHKDVDRARFIASRGILRTLLGEYLSASPEAVVLCALPGGKPSLDRETHPHAIHFNVSHCGGLALFAFADREVGIDVQIVAESNDIHRVVSHFFSSEERAAFEGISCADRTDFFFRTWVRKEAYLKATGEGLNTDPSTIHIGNAPTSEVTRTTPDGNRRLDTNFLIQDIAGIEGFAAAIAVSGAAAQHSQPSGQPVSASSIPLKRYATEGSVRTGIIGSNSSRSSCERRHSRLPAL